MKEIKIVTLESSDDCDICGFSYAVGGSVFVDGELLVEIEPQAHCYGSTSVEEHELLYLALSKLGIKIRIDGEKPFISNSEFSEELI